MPINLLTPADIPRALELSTAAGWNQIAPDWQRLLDLFPQTCFACRDDSGHILGTATLATYGNVGWIGMVLVDSTIRGRGIGGQLFDHACHAGRHLQTIGLDATDLGRPVYEKRGFQVHSQFTRWLIPNPPVAPHGTANLPANPRSTGNPPVSDSDTGFPPLSPSLLALDASAALIDRSALLNHLASEKNALFLCSDSAHAFARPGHAAWHIGPVIATDPADAQSLIRQLLHQIARRGGTHALLDLPAHTPLSNWLATQTRAPARHLVRMFNPPPARPYLTTPMIHAAAAFELG